MSLIFGHRNVYRTTFWDLIDQDETETEREDERRGSKGGKIHVIGGPKTRK